MTRRLHRSRAHFFVWIAVATALACADTASESPGRTFLARITALNASRYGIEGKEADWIYGDIALRNDRIAAIIANPVEGRNANWRVHDVGCAVIDLTRVAEPNDLLTLFRPGTAARTMQIAKEDAASLAEGSDRGLSSQTLRCVAEARGELEVELRYRLADGWDWIEVETIFTNRASEAIELRPFDQLRAEFTFQKSGFGRDTVRDPALFWAYDRFFGQAYGLDASGSAPIAVEAGEVEAKLHYQGLPTTLQAGGRLRLVRHLFPGRNLLDLRAIAGRLRELPPQLPVEITLEPPDGPVAAADVAVRVRGGRVYGWGRSDRNGVLQFEIPAGRYQGIASAPGREDVRFELEPERSAEYRVEFSSPASVRGLVRDEAGNPIPAKLQFRGRLGTPDPDFGPFQGVHGVQNLYYTHDGRVRVALAPGHYEVVVSRGPEYDAVVRHIQLETSRETPLQVTLVRSVDTTGWISTDFHSHSSPSGDNSSSQLGRVLNLLAEHIEFAPATEHDRLSSYSPHLDRLDAHAFMATSDGVELSGDPRGVNHQIAFPLVHRPHTQDGGAPRTRAPEEQIRALAEHDAESEKLVQLNHPDILAIFFDRTHEGAPSAGYRGMIPYIEAIEVGPLGTFLDPQQSSTHLNRVFHWLQILNRGHRFTGVHNTDAHHNFHGSGFRRNYVRSPTDEPGEIDPMDVVREIEAGHVVMTNAPFLEVELQAAGAGPVAIPGDDLAAPGGEVTLHARVQCANWYDIDRVQVVLNGRPSPELDFRRDQQPELFGDKPLRFDQRISLTLERDTHVIVIAVGENSKLGRVMGPNYSRHFPIAISNPVFVDVDGGGFEPNFDDLGFPVSVPEGG